jgi:hypothetical protein
LSFPVRKAASPSENPINQVNQVSEISSEFLPDISLYRSKLKDVSRVVSEGLLSAFILFTTKREDDIKLKFPAD